MIRFTRVPETGGIYISPELITENETLTFRYTDQQFVVGTETYSLLIHPHFGIKDDWRIEGLRDSEDVEIWFTGTFDDCITEFKKIETHIREQSHTIDEPDGFDMELAFRTHWKEVLALPRSDIPFREVWEALRIPHNNREDKRV